jgi:hypothetical protein
LLLVAGFLFGCSSSSMMRRTLDSYLMLGQGGMGVLVEADINAHGPAAVASFSKPPAFKQLTGQHADGGSVKVNVQVRALLLPAVQLVDDAARHPAHLNTCDDGGCCLQRCEVDPVVGTAGHCRMVALLLGIMATCNAWLHAFAARCISCNHSATTV